MGNPRLLAVDANADMDASRFNLVIWVKRDVLNFTIKNLFPVFIVIGVSYLVFFIPPREIGTRIGLGTSTLLTTAFFDLSLSSHLADIGYVVAVEYFFYVVYLLAVFGIMVTISGFIEAKAEKHGEKEALIKRLNLIGKFVYPAVIFITFALYVYFYGLARLLPPA
jgi:branched-chain amino acid transport system substrate-binding protein